MFCFPKGKFLYFGVKEQKVGGKIPRVHFTLRTVIIKYLIFIGNFGHATHCAENFSHHLI